MQNKFETTALIDGAELSNYEIAEDGSQVKIGLRDRSGRPAVLILPPECLSSLIMTLPAIMQKVLRRQTHDNSAKLVYPLARWNVERARGDPRFILSLSTPDGFVVSFSASQHELEMIGDAVAAADGTLLFN